LNCACKLTIPAAYSFPVWDKESYFIPGKFSIYSKNLTPVLRMIGLMDMIQILGLVAGACTSTAAVPQLIKTWKTKEAGDVSTGMFLLYVVGMSLWLTYGIIRSDIPIIATNSLALTFHGMMLYFKIKYKHHAPENKPATA
jgi:MtN3 and saliva related transmembrane protein